MSCTRRGDEDRTLCRTHIVLSVAHIWPSHAHACGSRAWRLKFGMCCTFAHLRSHPLTTWIIGHFLMCLTHFLPSVRHHLRQHRQHCLWLESGDPQRHSARRIIVWPSGRIHSSHRLRAQDLHRLQQGAHADQLQLEEKQLQHRVQRPYHHSRSLRNPWDERSCTVDFTTDVPGARSKL